MRRDLDRDEVDRTDILVVERGQPKSHINTKKYVCVCVEREGWCITIKI